MTALVVLFISTVIYFLPSILAYQKKHKNFGALLALNLLLGWTLLFWVVSLVWALMNTQSNQVNQGNQQV